MITVNHSNKKGTGIPFLFLLLYSVHEPLVNDADSKHDGYGDHQGPDDPGTVLNGKAAAKITAKDIQHHGGQGNLP